MSFRRCAVCSHPAHQPINERIRAGQSVELLAGYYGVSPEQLRRHRDLHMNDALLPSTAVRSISRMDVEARFGELEDLVHECRDLIEYARAKQHIQGWAMGIREARACMDQQNKMLGFYDQVDPRVAQGRSRRLIEVVAAALEQHPEAKDDVLAAINQVEENEG